MKILVWSFVLGVMSSVLPSVASAQNGNKISICGLSLEETQADDHEVVNAMNKNIKEVLKKNPGSSFAGLEIKEGELCASIQLPSPPPKMGEPGFDWDAYYQDAVNLGRSLGGHH